LPPLPDTALAAVLQRVSRADALRAAHVARAWAAAARPSLFAALIVTAGTNCQGAVHRDVLVVDGPRLHRLWDLAEHLHGGGGSGEGGNGDAIPAITVPAGFAASPLAHVRHLMVTGLGATYLVRTLRALARAGARLVQLDFDEDVTAEVVMALAPLTPRVTRLMLRSDDVDATQAGLFAALFAGRLTALGLYSWGDTARALLSGNRVGLRKLKAAVSWSNTVRKGRLVLQEFLSGGSRLCELCLSGFEEELDAAMTDALEVGKVSRYHRQITPPTATWPAIARLKVKDFSATGVAVLAAVAHSVESIEFGMNGWKLRSPATPSAWL
ncbi:hypothetical protein HK405_013495, partial [Cladochytrium tenue]